jgi:hypothetical protein
VPVSSSTNTGVLYSRWGLGGSPCHGGNIRGLNGWLRRRRDAELLIGAPAPPRDRLIAWTVHPGARFVVRQPPCGSPSSSRRIEPFGGGGIWCGGCRAPSTPAGIRCSYGAASPSGRGLGNRAHNHRILVGWLRLGRKNTLFSALYLGHRSSIVRPRCDRGFLRSWPLILDWTVGIAYRFGKHLDLIRAVRARSNGPNSPIPLRPGLFAKETP